MKRLIATTIIISCCLQLLSQNRLFRNLSPLERAEYYTSIAEISADSSETAAALDSAVTNYLCYLDRNDSLGPVEKISVYYKLSLCFISDNQYEDADIFIRLILKTAYEEYDHSSVLYAYSLLQVANIYSIWGDLAKAKAFMDLSEGSIKNNIRKDSDVYSIYMIDFLQTRINIKTEQQKFKSAVRDARRRIRLIRNAGLTDSTYNETYLDALMRLSFIYQSCPDILQARKCASRAYDLYTTRIIHGFSGKTAEERRQYWHSVSEYFNEMAGAGNDPKTAYNSSLFAKGILLNTTIEFNEFVKTNADSLIISDYNEMKKLIASGGNKITIDSLDQIINEKLEAKGVRFYPSGLYTSWEQVRNNLNDEDLAIEFMKNGNSYTCILLKKKWVKPRHNTFHISTDDFLYNTLSYSRKTSRQTISGILTGNDNLGQNIAESANGYEISVKESIYKIEDAVSDFDIARHMAKDIWTRWIRRNFPKREEGRIFFSPDGILDIIGIEYLPISKKQKDPGAEIYCLADIYPTYRLSSTRQLLFENQTSASHAVPGLYGSPDFMRKDKKILVGLAKAESGARRLLDNEYEEDMDSYSGDEGELQPLKAAMHEVLAIDSIMTDVGYKAHIFTGANASEDIFKIASQDENIIHIATHGFYLTPLEATRKRLVTTPETAKDPLSRSGLFMAGAKEKWILGSDPSGRENGILTANEISSLDLSNADMVILSACQTGIGDIGQDGIYGLQRAFKMAGAKSMIVSLWKISDEATAFMMKNFYQNRYILHMSKHEAFQAAQRAMRNTEKWKSPRYWSAFVLIDPEI